MPQPIKHNGPYHVVKHEDYYEVVERIKEAVKQLRVESLNPRRVYSLDQKTAAYALADRLNQKYTRDNPAKVAAHQKWFDADVAVLQLFKNQQKDVQARLEHHNTVKESQLCKDLEQKAEQARIEYFNTAPRGYYHP